MELFAKKGCKTITMDDIAASLGISKRTIYENFTDKESLLEACLHDFYDNDELNIMQVLHSSDNIIVAIFKLLENTSKFLFQLKFNFFNEMQKYYPETFNKTVLVYKQRFIENTEKLLQKGKTDGIVRKEVHPVIMAVLINEIFIIVHNKEIFAGYGFDKKHAMQVCMGCITRGMFTEKGIQILDEHILEHKKMRYDETN
jgi:AcrR family transcriptional regulator